MKPHMLKPWAHGRCVLQWGYVARVGVLNNLTGAQNYQQLKMRSNGCQLQKISGASMTFNEMIFQ